MSIPHLHLLLNHIPVLGAFLALLVFGAALLRRRDEWARAGLWLVLALAAVTVVVYFTGEPAEELVEHLSGVSERAIERHEDAALFATIAFCAAGLLALTTIAMRRRREIGVRLTTAALVVVLAVSGAIGYAAGLGGLVRHTELQAGAVSDVRGDSSGAAANREGGGDDGR